MSDSDFQKILLEIEKLLPKDKEGKFIAFSQSIPVKEAIKRGYLSKEEAEKFALKDDDPSGYSEEGKPLEQSDVVHDFLAFLAEQMIELNKKKQEEIKGFLKWLESKLKIKSPEAESVQGVDSLRGRKQLKNYIGDYQKNEPSLSFEQFWQILEKNRKLISANLDSREFREMVAKEYEKSLSRLLGIRKKLELTDSLIDQIIYRLYGLNQKEIDLIEETFRKSNK